MSPIYVPTVSVQATPKLGQNAIPERRRYGKTRNSGSDASTNQKMLCDSAATD